MAGIQLSCPHCAARLSFGQSIPAGTTVSCLVCNRAFVAPGPAVPVAAHAAAASKAPSSSSPALSKQRIQSAPVAPGNSPARSRSAPRESSADTPPPARSAPRQDGNAGRIIGAAALVGIAVLLLAGLGYVFWKNALQPRTDDGQPTPPVVAQLPGKPDDKTSIPPAPISEKNKDDAGKKKDDAGKKKDDAGKKKDGVGPAGQDDDDIANQKKLEKPPPPPPITEIKQPPEKTPDVPAAPPVEVVVKGSPAVPGVTQALVDAAIAKGVRYLRDKQLPDGRWGSEHVVGYTCLAGLTLLECKVPANDPAVQRAYQYVLANIATLSTTYEISTAIMFLDRLGDSKNRLLIQGLGVRLLAGQNDSGGWSYSCPLHNVADMRQLHMFLRSHGPGAVPVTPAAPAGDLADNPIPAAAGIFNSLVTQLAPPTIAMVDGSAVPLPGGAEKPVLTTPYRPDGGAWPPPPKGKGVQPIALNQMPAHLQALPVVQLSVNKGWLTAQRGGGDHSNTQFALLALWAARRHGTPSDYALLLSYQRFKRVQAANGSWGYGPGEYGGSSTMTCAGLLAMAVGLGVVPDTADKEKLESGETQRGLNALGGVVGIPVNEENARPPMQNLYLLWSIERVAMLHDLKTIGGKDWYGWGAQILLANQQSDGNWSGGQYLGSSATIDTCFALLFLKRANLVGDLTESLRLRMIIRDPGAK